MFATDHGAVQFVAGFLNRSVVKCFSTAETPSKVQLADAEAPRVLRTQVSSASGQRRTFRLHF